MANNHFFGRCYLYNTPEGRKPIGVTRGLGDVWIVAYARNSGARRRIVSKSLEPGPDPERLQNSLDCWAYGKGLRTVRVDLRPCWCGTSMVEICRHSGLHAPVPSWRVRCTGCGVSTAWCGTEGEAVQEWEVLG